MTAARKLTGSSLAGSLAICLGHLAQVGCSGELDGSSADPALTAGSPSGTATGMSTVADVATPGVAPLSPATTSVGTPAPDTVPAGTAPGDNAPVGAGGTANAGGAGNAVPQPDVTNLPDEPSTGSVRRLTHVEYDNTIADLLGDSSNPSTAFEVDIAQDGFTNNAAGQNVSPTLVEQYMVAAETLSQTATQDLPALLNCDPASLGEQACVQLFIQDFGRRVWRRPLLADEEARMQELFDTARAEYEFDVSVQMVVQAFLQSPQFTYLLEPLPDGATAGSVAPLNSWEVATRLSYFLLGSMPDETLFAEAEAGRLDTSEAVAAQARRLLEMPRARDRVALFFIEWLRLRDVDRLQKDAAMFPEYELHWGAMMQEQVRLFAQSVVLDDGGTAKDLLTAPYTFVNRELAPLYGAPTPLDDQFHRVELDPTQRAGLLTQVALLANLAHGNQTDPVLRGKFVRTSVLCDAIPSPPADAAITVPEITPGATTRERFAQHQEDPTCAVCHVFMDPIGLGFEHYDPLGQWREMDNGLAVDATGEIFGTDVAGTFDGAIELSQKLANSQRVMDCMAQTWLRFALGRSDVDTDAGALAVAGARFEASGFTMRELLVALTETRAFRYQVALDPNTSSLTQETP